MRTWHLVLAASAAASLAVACGESFDGAELRGVVEFEPSRPTYTTPAEIAPYTGSNEIVLEAQSRMRTGLDLHQKVIFRTCTPFDGVCHNQKEYPDLHTPGAFVQAIGAPCNVQADASSAEWEAVYDRCEQLGDRFRFGRSGPEVEIGWLEFKPAEGGEYRDLGDNPDADSPGLHIHLREPISINDRRSAWGAGYFVRTFVNAQDQVEDLDFASFDTRWYVLGDGTHILGQVRNYQVDQIEQLLGVGLVQGDLNRNGIFGARVRPQVPLINPGNPEESYLIARLRGTMGDEAVPGSRMPLANKPLSMSEMLALYCWVEGLEYQPHHDLSWPIDYARCSYSADPENLNLLGEGVTWERRVSRILEFNCGGCHAMENPQGQLTLLGSGVYERLLQPSLQRPELKLIEPGNPMQSYLYLKLIGDSSILGSQMPFDPFTGVGRLRDSELADIETWIINGAVENE